MSISIVTRSYRSSELGRLCSEIEKMKLSEIEIVAVCDIMDQSLDGVRLIIESTNMFEARITGILNATHEKLLLIDSDQTINASLLFEIEALDFDMVIIPERSKNNNLLGRSLDDWRLRNFNVALKFPNPIYPVIPRLYKKELLLQAIKLINPTFYKMIDHEDSILYYSAYQISKNIGFAHEYIFNYDPSFISLMRKAFNYGKSSSIFSKKDLPNDINILLKQINRNTLNFKELGIGKGSVIQALRGISYWFGKIIG